MGSKTVLGRKHYVIKKSELISFDKQAEFGFGPCSHLGRITSYGVLSHCISVAFVMEIDAGVDDS